MNELYIGGIVPPFSITGNTQSIRSSKAFICLPLTSCIEFWAISKISSILFRILFDFLTLFTKV